jgi:hypothetical protein
MGAFADRRGGSGVDIYAALVWCAPPDQLLRAPWRAGLVMSSDDASIFRRELSRAVAAIWDRTAVRAGTSVDALVSMSDLTLELAQQIERLGPFGEGNPPVTLAMRDVAIAGERAFGRRGEHREVTLEDRQGLSRRVIWWRGADEDMPQGRLDVAVTVKSTDYRGAHALSIEWVDARVIEAARIEIARAAIEVVDWRGLPTLRSACTAWSRRTTSSCGRTESSVPSASLRAGAGGGSTALRSRACEVAGDLARAGRSRELVCAGARFAETAYVCDAGDADDRLESFIRRLAGCSTRSQHTGGHVDVARLAAAAGNAPRLCGRR